MQFYVVSGRIDDKDVRQGSEWPYAKVPLSGHGRFRAMRSLILAVILMFNIHVWAADSIDIGPAIGTPIPDGFHLKNTDGDRVVLKDITGDKGVVLAFVRSADWCPFCQNQLIELNGITEALSARGYTLASVSYDTPEVLTRFIGQRQIAYTMLSDESSEMIDAFDIRDPQYGPDSRAYGVPRPAIFIVGTDGVVQDKLAVEGYRERPPSEDVVNAIDRILGAAS